MPVEEIASINGQNQEKHAIPYFEDDICNSGYNLALLLWHAIWIITVNS